METPGKRWIRERPSQVDRVETAGSDFGEPREVWWCVLLHQVQLNGLSHMACREREVIPRPADLCRRNTSPEPGTLHAKARAGSKIRANQEKQNFDVFYPGSAEYRENKEMPPSQSHARLIGLPLSRRFLANSTPPSFFMGTELCTGMSVPIDSRALRV